MSKTSAVSRRRQPDRQQVGAVASVTAQPAATKPKRRSELVRALKYIALANGAVATLKAGWDNMHLAAAQFPELTTLLGSITFYTGALMVYSLGAFLSAGFILMILAEGSGVGETAKQVCFAAIAAACLAWGGYKTFFNPDPTLVTLYVRIIGGLALAIVGYVVYSDIKGRAETTTA